MIHKVCLKTQSAPLHDLEFEKSPMYSAPISTNPFRHPRYESLFQPICPMRSSMDICRDYVEAYSTTCLSNTHTAENSLFREYNLDF